MAHPSTAKMRSIFRRTTFLACAFAAFASCTRSLHNDKPLLPPGAGLSAERAPAAVSAGAAVDATATGGRSIIDEVGIAPETLSNGAAASITTPLSGAEPAFIVQTGKSRLIRLDRPVRRVSVGNPEVADIILVSPTEVLVNGRKPGDTSLILWDQHGVSELHTITVEETSERQVLLEITVAELNRTAMEEHGVDYRVLRSDLGLAFQPAKVAPLFGEFPTVPPNPLFQSTLSDPVTLAVLDPKRDIAVFFEFIQREGLGKILARPRLIARSGREAKFLSGGEIPIIIAEALQTSVVFKEFGVRVRFKPTVLADDTIDLEVAPEVSEPDFANGVKLFGFSVPAFITRRVDTRVTLRDGESLVIAGLFRETRAELQSKVPYLGDIPGLGYLFRKTSYNRAKDELMIVVRPRLAKAIPPGVSVSVPDREPLRSEDVRTQPTDAPITRPRLPGPEPSDEAATTSNTGTSTSFDAPVSRGGAAPAHAWSVQVSATKDAATADALVASLRSKGYDAYQVTIRRDGVSLYRVRVGAYASLEQAVNQAKRLRRERDVREAVIVSD